MIKNIFVTLLTCLSIGILIFLVFKYTNKEEVVNKTQINEVATSTDASKTLNTCAWLPWWDWAESEKQFMEIGKFTTASPFIYTVNASGKLNTKVEDLDGKLKSLRGKYEIIPTIYNEFDGDRISLILNNEDILKSHIEDIFNLVKNNNYAGIDIDYEFLHASDKEGFSIFIEDLSKKLHDSNKKLIVTVHPKTDDSGVWHGSEAQDWAQIAKHADTVRIMVYGYHWAESEPGAIAPLDWLRNVAIYANEVIPFEKRVLAIGLYAVDWQENIQPAKEYTLNELEKIKRTYAGKLETGYDSLSESPFLKYSNHTVWYENEESLEKKLNLSLAHFSGICIWRSGGIPNKMIETLKTKLW